MKLKELDKYNYPFPNELIANRPASPRDSAKLLVYDRKSDKAQYDTFLNLPKYLPKGAVLVMNDTKVIPARLTLTKPMGGKVRVLYVSHERNIIKVLTDTRIAPGTKLLLHKRIAFTILAREGEYCLLKPSFNIKKIYAILEQYGTAPLPPYIKNTPFKEKRLREEYQSVFARVMGSIAAPTASLHFTKRLLVRLKKAGHEVLFVTLHVGLGTFKPLTEERMKSGVLHEEYYAIDRRTAEHLNAAKRVGKPIIAVGTTVVRTLESATKRGQIQAGERTTDLFIRPGYKFRFVDGLITNFHVPKSSLLMLVSAFATRAKILSLYRAAIRRRFRLFSFGDGMLIV